jgi:hypothetical protein
MTLSMVKIVDFYKHDNEINKIEKRNNFYFGANNRSRSFGKIVTIPPQINQIHLF